MHGIMYLNTYHTVSNKKKHRLLYKSHLCTHDSAEIIKFMDNIRKTDASNDI